MRCLLILSLVAFGTSVGPRASVAGAPHERGPWVVGVAYGPARAKITGSDSLTTRWLEGPAQSVRLGYRVTPQVKVGYEHQAWLREQGFHDLKIRAGTQLEALAVTTYLAPPGSRWNRFYVVAGGGWAHCRLTFLEPLAPGESAIGDTYEIAFKQDEYGWGGFGGVGYEYQVTRSFAAGVTMSYNYLDIGGDIFDSAEFVPLTASVNWSF